MLFSGRPSYIHIGLVSRSPARPEWREFFPETTFHSCTTESSRHPPRGALPWIIRVPSVIPLGIVLHNVKKILVKGWMPVVTRVISRYDRAIRRREKFIFFDSNLALVAPLNQRIIINIRSTNVNMQNWGGLKVNPPSYSVYNNVERNLNLLTWAQNDGVKPRRRENVYGNKETTSRFITAS